MESIQMKGENVKKKMIGFFVLLNFFGSNDAVLIQLPNKATLMHRLRTHKLDDIADRTDLAERLKDKNIEKLGICFAIASALYDYKELPQEQQERIEFNEQLFNILTNSSAAE